ncbi:MAG TPA: helix-turn-helix domain-containing protein [Acidimicrobiales bacterium]|nr:helix-turn-helix domain-containing protein [Acidimicrobiales bacterium]
MAFRRLALKVKEAADAFGVGRDAVYNAINRGEIRATRFGGTLLVPQVELERILGVEPEHATIRDALRELVEALET